MIPHPDRPGWFIAIVHPSIVEDLRRPVSDEDWARWDLEAEWDNMWFGGDAYGIDND